MVSPPMARSSTSIKGVSGVSWPLLTAISVETRLDPKTVARAARELAGLGPSVRGRAGAAARAALLARGIPKAAE